MTVIPAKGFAAQLHAMGSWDPVVWVIFEEM